MDNTLVLVAHILIFVYERSSQSDEEVYLVTRSWSTTASQCDLLNVLLTKLNGLLTIELIARPNCIGKQTYNKRRSLVF